MKFEKRGKRTVYAVVILLLIVATLVLHHRYLQHKQFTSVSDAGYTAHIVHHQPSWYEALPQWFREGMPTAVHRWAPPDPFMLAFGRGDISLDSLANLSELPRLKGIYLEHSSVTDNHLAALESLTELELLSLKGRISDDSMALIAANHSLTSLRINSADVTDSGLLRLIELRSLEHLSLKHSPRITDASVDLILSFPKLNSLWLFKTGLTSAGVERIRKSRPDLEINFCCPYTDGVAGEGDDIDFGTDDSEDDLDELFQ